MNKMERLQKYFNAWNAQNQIGIGECLAENCYLKDWELAETGKSAVMAANQMIWTEVEDDIQIIIKNIVLAENIDKAYAELLVYGQDGNIALDVIDVFTFDDDNFITDIQAYKQ
jgi:hypothetical protein